MNMVVQTRNTESRTRNEDNGSSELRVPGSAIERLSDLPQLLQGAEGFAEVKEALRASRSGVIDGAWGSSQSLAVAALGSHAPATVLVVIAHPGDLGAWSDELLGFA